eukprot:CAMPEP_0198322666 /NCGR_PEP_ID=MMETSP1450-20131203/11092_1 /TAXON_ID=753684 ORGANISM="Madagascaria erythrocladiodes, Strain CCMP3234" /NCGR_SAMPLE_ID=MMETSP1450 /ASSEMBLY_ACC=CAM_ASM_001115 /LENGTH=98 /DNA_ID=CAMNT_0044026297 /DNA_START=427 /DNA_END=720 /DNA_ORIENTATION=-
MLTHEQLDDSGSVVECSHVQRRALVEPLWNDVYICTKVNGLLYHAHARAASAHANTTNGYSPPSSLIALPVALTALAGDAQPMQRVELEALADRRRCV